MIIQTKMKLNNFLKQNGDLLTTKDKVAIFEHIFKSKLL